MAKQYINFKVGEQLASLTTLRPNEVGENIIQTTIVNNIGFVADPGSAGLQLGRAHKGSIRPIITEDGSVALQVRPFQQVADPIAIPETLHSTEHGRMYRTSRKTRIIFGFPRHASFEAISDALDDECYELRSYLDASD